MKLFIGILHIHICNKYKQSSSIRQHVLFSQICWLWVDYCLLAHLPHHHNCRQLLSPMLTELQHRITFSSTFHDNWLSLLLPQDGYQLPSPMPMEFLYRLTGYFHVSWWLNITSTATWWQATAKSGMQGISTQNNLLFHLLWRPTSHHIPRVHISCKVWGFY